MVHVLAELPRGMDSLLLFIAGVHDVDGISRVLAGTMTQSTLQRSKIKSRERSKSRGTDLFRYHTGSENRVFPSFFPFGMSYPHIVPRLI